MGAGPGSRSGPQWTVGEGEKAKALPVPGEDGLETEAGSSTCVSGPAWHLLASGQGPDSHQGDCAAPHRLLGHRGAPQAASPPASVFLCVCKLPRFPAHPCEPPEKPHFHA